MFIFPEATSIFNIQQHLPNYLPAIEIIIKVKKITYRDIDIWVDTQIYTYPCTFSIREHKKLLFIGYTEMGLLV